MNEGRDEGLLSLSPGAAAALANAIASALSEGQSVDEINAWGNLLSAASGILILIGGQIDAREKGEVPRR